MRLTDLSLALPLLLVCIMLFWEPLRAIIEALTVRNQGATASRKARAIELLKLVSIPLPDERFDAYPHRLSGGMRQCVMMATALACSPSLIIAD